VAEHEMTTPADIDQLLLGRENENLEFKHAANSFDFELLLLKHLERFGPASMKDLQDVVPSADRRSIQCAESGRKGFARRRKARREVAHFGSKRIEISNETKGFCVVAAGEKASKVGQNP
jgi:hypothetical protein